MLIVNAAVSFHLRQVKSPRDTEKCIHLKKSFPNPKMSLVIRSDSTQTQPTHVSFQNSTCTVPIKKMKTESKPQEQSINQTFQIPKMESTNNNTNPSNWSEAVEDLISEGNISEAISLVESTIQKLQTLNSPSSSSQFKLSTALNDLANLYSSQHLSDKSDQLRTQAFLIKQNALHIESSLQESEKKGSDDISDLKSDTAAASTSNAEASSDDDWEAVADRVSVEEVFAPKISESIISESISKISLEDSHIKTPKRRGRGSFFYKKNSLYSDEQHDDAITDDTDDTDDHDPKSEENMKKHNSRYGTKHVLVLADFSPSMRTIDLEKIFENFKDRGVVIRWVNDTVALAVFRTVSIALEAYNSIHCPFKVRVLSEDDALFPLVSIKDLEPPVPRPKTSARTAERLIAQGMGIKLSKTPNGSSEHRKQEEARKNRIVTRQILKNDAWGDDD